LDKILVRVCFKIINLDLTNKFQVKEDYFNLNNRNNLNNLQAYLHNHKEDSVSHLSNLQVCLINQLKISKINLLGSLVKEVLYFQVDCQDNKLQPFKIKINNLL